MWHKPNPNQLPEGMEGMQYINICTWGVQVCIWLLASGMWSMNVCWYCLCRASHVSLRALACVFTAYELKLKACCLSDEFDHVWTWTLTDLTLITGLFLTQSPFPEGKCTVWPSFVPSPIHSVEEQGMMLDSFNMTTCGDGGVSQRKRGFCYQKGGGNACWADRNHRPLQCPSCVEGFTAKLWSTVRQKHHLRGLPSLDSRTTYLPQVAHSRWQLPSPLYFTLYSPFPFGNPRSSQGNGRHLMNYKNNWGASSMLLPEYN